MVLVYWSAGLILFFAGVMYGGFIADEKNEGR
jgi:hypothetical protein